MNKPLGIYIHIPFCVKRCAYCDFYSGADISLSAEYKNALIKHIRSYKNLHLTADTVYFGGGTPTYFGADGLCDILKCIFDTFCVLPNAEISAECNPNTASTDAFKRMHSCGFNRLSIGIQSFSDRELLLLGRAHSASDGINTVRSAKKAGFDNISCDLMFGIPDQSIHSFSESLDRLLSLDITHASSYILKLEEHTEMYACKDSYAFPSEDEICDMIQMCRERMEHYGMHRYEISNYAKSGYESRHNLKYWSRNEYLAFGPSASGFYNGIRYTFTPDIKKYISLANGKISLDEALCEKETPSQNDAVSEYLMLSLRLVRGVDKGEFKKRTGKELDCEYGDKVAPYIKGGFMESDTHLRFTSKGFDVSNAILSDILDFDG